HPRIVTGCQLFVVVISEMISSMMGRSHILLRLASRIVLIPVVAGIAYEYIRLLARNLDKPLARILVAPQLWLQKLTTREPSLDMLEVSITALQNVLATEHLPVPAQEPEAAAVKLS